MGVLVLKELIFNSFYFGWLILSAQERVPACERTEFQQLILLVGAVVLKELIFSSYLFGWVWWFWKNWFLTVDSFGGCDGHDFNSLLFGWVWWFWKNWFLTVSTLDRWGGLERTVLEQFLLWVTNAACQWKGACMWKNWILTVDTLGGCSGLERTDF